MSETNKTNNYSKIVYDKKNGRVEIEGSEVFTEKMFNKMWENGLLEWDFISMQEQISPNVDKAQSAVPISKVENSNNNTTTVSKSKPKSYPNQIQLISNDVRDVDIEKLNRIYHFDKDPEIPYLTVTIDDNSRTKQQRPAVHLILYAYSVITGNDELSSKSFTDPLQFSGIDPSNLFAIKSKTFNKLVQSNGGSYSITPIGKIQARKLLNEIEPYD